MSDTLRFLFFHANMQVMMFENILAPVLLAIPYRIFPAMTTFLSVRSDSLLVGSIPGRLANANGKGTSEDTGGAAPAPRAPPPPPP